MGKLIRHGSFALALILTTLLSLAWQPQVAAAQSGGGGYGSACYQPTRLSAGYQARVTTWPNLPNRLRSGAGYHQSIIGRIPAGGVFHVIEGPRCVNNLNWWRVNYNGVVGWTAEGNGYNSYWVEPLSVPPPPQPVCVLPNRLSIGSQGRVTPGLPNVVRTAPGTMATGANSQVIGRIRAGGIFDVLNGPQCGTDGRWWWYVNYRGLIGWTAEGEGYNNYWLEPIHYTPPPQHPQCPGSLPSRLTVGHIGAVTTWPDLPNTVRSQPWLQSSRVGQIPVGGVFQILSGPYCNNGSAWWQVSYQGLVGWTIESGNGNYWLEPR